MLRRKYERAGNVGILVTNTNTANQKIIQSQLDLLQQATEQGIEGAGIFSELRNLVDGKGIFTKLRDLVKGNIPVIQSSLGTVLEKGSIDSLIPPAAQAVVDKIVNVDKKDLKSVVNAILGNTDEAKNVIDKVINSDKKELKAVADIALAGQPIARAITERVLNADKKEIKAVADVIWGKPIDDADIINKLLGNGIKYSKKKAGSLNPDNQLYQLVNSLGTDNKVYGRGLNIV